MSRRTVRIGGREVPAIAFWIAGVALFVLIVPMLTFYLREQGLFTDDGGSGAPVGNPVRQAGTIYSVERLFSLESRDFESFLPRSAGPEQGHSPFLEVVAPAPDGSVLVVHHPPESGVIPHVRRLARDGSILASFEVTSGATLFTLGNEGDLWVDVASGSGDQERAVHYSAAGEVLGVYPLPAGLFARSLEIDPDGGVWALSEEWAIDPTTKAVSLQSALVPVALGVPLTVPQNPAALVLDGAFWGDDGLLYRVRSEGQIAEGMSTPAWAVTSWTKQGEQIASYSLPADVRPFAADASGRLYAERLNVERSIAGGLSTLGDPASETTLIWVVDREGRATKVPVWKPTYFSNWAPSAWPRADGTLLAVSQDGANLDVLQLSPGSFVEAIAAEPFGAELTIIEPSEPVSGDPYAATDDAQRDVLRLVYSGLVSLDASLSPVPDIAAEVPTRENGLVSADGLTIRWNIKGGITWHDGEPVSAEDVVATWRYLTEASYLPHARPFPGFDAIEEVFAEDSTVTVRLSRPIGVAPVAFFPYVLPAHLLPSERTANPPLFAAPLGCGPYRLTRWEDGSGWYLKSHENASRRPGEVHALHVVFAYGEGARQSFDAAGTPVVWDWVDEVRTAELRQDGVEVAAERSGRWWGVLFDAAAGPTTDERVREALKAIYPRSVLHAEIYEPAETSEPVDAYPVGSEAHDGSRRVEFGDDPAEALRLLAQAGWRLRYDEQLTRDVLTRGSEQLSITGNHTHREWNDSEVPPDAADAIQMAWRALGFRDSYNYASFRHYESWWRFGMFSFDDFQVGLGVLPSTPDPGWGGIFDPRDAPSVDNPYGIGVTGTADDVLEGLYAEAEAEYDPTRRAEIGREITRRAFDELDLAIGERYEMRRIATSGQVAGFIIGPVPSGAFSDVSQWRFDGDEQ